jgi:hypothetical protein
MSPIGLAEGRNEDEKYEKTEVFKHFRKVFSDKHHC